MLAFMMRKKSIFRSAKEEFYGKIIYVVKHFRSSKYKKAMSVRRFHTPEEVEKYCYKKKG